MGRRGFPGMGGGNMNQMMNKMKKMQKEMGKMEEDLNEKEVEASVGGGAITAVANGKKEIISIKIDESVVDPEDVDMLEDLVLAAVNEVMRKADAMVEEEMKKITGGLNIPGL